MIAESERRVWIEHQAENGMCTRCKQLLPTKRTGTVWLSPGMILWVKPFTEPKVCPL